jgi:hypothetical protein
MSVMRALLCAVFVADSIAVAQGQSGAPSDASSTSPGNTKTVDFAPIFSHRVTIPGDLEKRGGDVVWKATNLLEKDAPRFRHSQPRAGDFALYYVSHAFEPIELGKRRLVSTGDYLMLEIVCPSWRKRAEDGDANWDEDSNVVAVRVYGAARSRDSLDPTGSSLTFRGLIASAGRAGFPVFTPSQEMITCDDNSISISDIAYFRDYKAFAAETREKSGEGRDDRLTWTKLDTGADLGQLWRFKWNYSDMDDPAGGIETVIVSEKVPVRGLVFAKDEWSSSSGQRNHTRTVQLVNYGRLTADHVKTMQAYEDVLPEELKLWTELKDKLAPKEP